MRIAHSTKNKGLCASCFVLSFPFGIRLVGRRGAGSGRRRGFFFDDRLPPIPVVQAFTTSRRMGPPGVITDTFRARSSDIRSLPSANRGLCPVLRTRPDAPRLKSACPLPLGTGHTCTSTHAFASGFLQAHLAENTLAFGYPSPSPGWVWTLTDTCVTMPTITS